MINLKNVSFSWPDSEAKCLQDLSLNIQKGEVIALTGDNGAGKSTLFKLLMGLLKPEQGEILINSQNISHLNAGDRALLIGLLFQEPERQFFQHTVYNEIAYGLKIRQLHKDVIQNKIEEILTEFHLIQHKDAHPLDLNSAEKRMVTLASLAVLDQPVLLLDEPSRDLDDDWLALFENWLIKQSQHHETTIIAISHDTQFINRRFSKILKLEKGMFING